MSDKSAIAWTDATWNPVTGCTKLSPGCASCYAERIAHRFGRSFEVTLHPDRLDIPLRWRKPRRVFVCSMGDLFHPDVPDGFIARVWDVMGKTPHAFQILTKRPERMRDWVTRWYDTRGDSAVDQFKGGRERGPEATRARYTSGRSRLFAAMIEEIGPPPAGMAYQTYDWMEGWRYWTKPHNVWLGTSIENDRFVGRADALRETPAAVRFISAEPLLGPLPSLNLTGIDWLIVGGESGPGHRPMDPAWVRDLVERADAAGCAVFVKQASGSRPGKQGNLPDDLWARKEYPA